MADKTITGLTNEAPTLASVYAHDNAGAISKKATHTQLLALISANVSPPDYAALITEDGSTPQSFSNAPSKFTGFAATGLSNGATPSIVTNDITIATTGIYFILFQDTFSGAGNTTFEYHLRVDGVEQAEGTHRKMSAGGDVGSVSFAALASLTAGEVVSIYGESDDGVGENATPLDAQLIVVQIPFT